MRSPLRRLDALREQLAASLWFVPGAIVLCAVALGVVLVELSGLVDGALVDGFPRFFGASADGSREMLGVIAGSVITVAGVTFSITVAAVAQASAQYTPRILRNFMRDRANQVVLGTFLGIFAYCLVVLRSIRSAEELLFVPRLAVFIGFLLALLGVGVLVFFIHHIASSLQASSIIERVSRDTLDAIDRLFPETLGEEAPDDEGTAALDSLDGARWQPVPALASGYVQSVGEAELIALARDRRVVVRMERGVGEFAVESTPLASLTPAPDSHADADADAAHAETARAVAGLFALSPYRTVHQDAAFGVRQLVDVALKALSPGVNDTTTAVTCVDYLTAILVRLVRRRVEGGLRAEDGEVRVIASGPTFDGLLALAFDEIRRSAEAGGNVTVLDRQLDALDVLGRCAASGSRRRRLREHAERIAEAAGRGVPAPEDRARLADRARSVGVALEDPPGDRARMLESA